MSLSLTARRDRERVISDSNSTHIRWMIRRDLPDVMAIELSSFDFAWTEDEFLRCLRQRNCIGMVAERGETILGFMIYELHRSRLNVLNFAVHPTVRRAGIGSMLVRKLVYKLCLTVREGNTPAQMFFRAHRFKAARVLRNHYEDNGEDAYEMEFMPEAEEWAAFGGPPINRISVYE